MAASMTSRLKIVIMMLSTNYPARPFFNPLTLNVEQDSGIRASRPNTISNWLCKNLLDYAKSKVPELQ